MSKCLFCDNEAMENKEICKECEDIFKDDVDIEWVMCGKCGVPYAECGCHLYIGGENK